MTDIEIRPITAAETRTLRSIVLRPGQSPDQLIYPGDDAPEALHLGAFLNDELVGIASIYPELPPWGVNEKSWRLRGMATRPEVQGKGCGRALLKACIKHIARQGGELFWCNGRTSAAGFYRALGFELYGDEFVVPESGPHYVMYRRISRDES